MDWDGPSLPVEVVPRGQFPEGQPVPDLEGTTDKPIPLPPGTYMAKVLLPAWTGAKRGALTVEVHIEDGENVQPNLAREFANRLSGLRASLEGPFGASVSVQPTPATSGGLPSGPSVDLSLKIPTGIDVTATVNASLLSRVPGAAGGTQSASLFPQFDALPAAFEADAPALPKDGDSGTLPELVTTPVSEARRYVGEHGLLVTTFEKRSCLAVVPVDRTGATVATFSPPELTSAGPVPLRLDLAFEDAALNTLWLFMRSGGVRESRSLAATVPGTSKWLDGELGVFKRSPITATLEAYILLRANWRDELRDFTAQVLGEQEYLADMRVIHAEALGRLGDHAAAASVLSELGTGPQPWPLFRPGAAYALARARLYSEGKEDDGRPVLDEAVKAKLSQLASALSVLCAAMDPGQIPLVLTGSRPPEDLRKLLLGLKR